MKITLNLIIEECIKNGEKLYLPKIGCLQMVDGSLKFDYPYNSINARSVIEIFCMRYGIDMDVALQRYEYWRNAITTKADGHDVIHIDGVIWIIVNSNNEYYYQSEIKDTSIK